MLLAIVEFLMQASWSQCRTFLPQRHSPQFRLHLPAAEPIIVTSLIPLCCKSTSAGSFHGFLSDLDEALCLGPAINLCFPAAKCQQRNSIHVAVQHSVCASSSDGCRRIFVCRRGVPLSYTRQQLVDFLKRHADGLVCQSMTLLRWMEVFLSGNSIRTSTLFSCLRSQMHKAKASS